MSSIGCTFLLVVVACYYAVTVRELVDLLFFGVMIWCVKTKRPFEKGRVRVCRMLENTAGRMPPRKWAMPSNAKQIQLCATRVNMIIRRHVLGCAAKGTRSKVEPKT